VESIHRVTKPWGFEIWWAVTEDYAAKLLHVEQGHRLSLQYHREKDESCYLLSGLVRLTRGSSLDALVTSEVSQGSAWRNRPGDIHTIEALETSCVLEASTPQLEDVVRLLDDYGRPSEGGSETQADVVAHTDVPAKPSRLLDREQIAGKLRLRREQAQSVINDPSFPPPAGYFRGRILWEETAIEAWSQPVDVRLQAAR
jgi:mannose-6-phosphate isomerase-like protein (cupin superfamily)